MKKSYNKKKEIYDALQKNRGKIKRRSIMLALLFLGVNIFAWFVYVTKVDVNVKSKVISWDVNFFDGPEQVKEININETIYPGMDTYTKVVEVNNSSEIDANFEYVVNSFTVLGIDSMVEDGTNEEQIASLQNDYPFVITMNADKTNLGQDEKLTFVLNIDWTFENEGEYHRLTKHFTYDPSVTYYALNESEFLPYSVNAYTFEQHKTDLYLQKDDADSFFGEACAAYQKSTGLTCINLKVTLTVSQAH